VNILNKKLQMVDKQVVSKLRERQRVNNLSAQMSCVTRLLPTNWIISFTLNSEMVDVRMHIIPNTAANDTMSSHTIGLLLNGHVYIMPQFSSNSKRLGIGKGPHYKKGGCVYQSIHVNIFL
jgi:hypothetical protein